MALLNLLIYTLRLSQLRGFIDSCTFDNLIITGDFNVDFSRSSVLRDSLQLFMNDLSLCASDLLSANITFTYERDDGLIRSWPEHTLSFEHNLSFVRDIKCVHSADNFSDDIPLTFRLSLCCPDTFISGAPPIDHVKAIN